MAEFIPKDVSELLLAAVEEVNMAVIAFDDSVADDVRMFNQGAFDGFKAILRLAEDTDFNVAEIADRHFDQDASEIGRDQAIGMFAGAVSATRFLIRKFVQGEDE